MFVGDGVSFESTPGHTPGHVSVHIDSKDEKAIISGDMMHHPCQIARPEWVTPFDADNGAAMATRKAFLERYADQPVLILGTHFANPVRGPHRARWRYLSLRRLSLIWRPNNTEDLTTVKEEPMSKQINWYYFSQGLNQL